MASTQTDSDSKPVSEQSPPEDDFTVGLRIGALPPDEEDDANEASKSARPAPVEGEEIKPEDDQRSLGSLESEIGGVAEEEDGSDAVADAALRGGDCNLPPELMGIVDARLAVWIELIAIDDCRLKLRSEAGAREIRDEISRQDRELQRTPTAEMLDQAIDELTRRLKNPILPSLASKDRPAPKPGEATPESVYKRVLETGLAQCRLLQKRQQLDPQVPAASLRAAAGEPLLTLCRRIDVECEPLMGWTFYAIGLCHRLAECRKAEEAHSAEVNAARSQASSGLFSRLKTACLGREEVAPLDPQVRRLRTAIEKELKAIEPSLTEMFWKLYSDLAWAFVSCELTPPEKVTIRAMLRYGMVAGHPGLISPELRDFILLDCDNDVYDWKNTPDALHVVYADEYIVAIHDRRTSVSPDEDMELNCRGSDEWKADRIWRQAAIYSVLHQLYNTRCEDLKKSVDELAAAREKLEHEYAAIRNSSRKAQATKLGDLLAKTRADLARLRQALERFETKLVPEVKARAEDAGRRLVTWTEKLTPEQVVRREAQFVRRLARLTARLKEPYLPFVLRDWFVPGRSDHFSRTLLKETVSKLEKGDPRVFHQVVIGNKKLDRRVTVRMSPTFLIVPGRGQMGLSLCPRQWDDCGRMVLPLCFQRQGALENALIEMFADFRWDCSKEEAGMDWITADALCAAYAAVRWNYRRLSEDAQKAMGIDKKLKDKQNWRLHYRLYLASAHERGRFLFNKCYDVYKDVVLRYIGLAPGMEPLKRD